MNVIIYRDFSDSYETKQINAQGKIKDVFADYSFDKYAFIVNSVRQDENYYLKEGDSVIIRAIPHMTGVMIASAVIAGISAIVGGVAAYKAKKQAQDAQDELDKIKNSVSSDSSSITNPMMSGASNTVATGKTQPFVMGRRLFTPYLLTSEWDNLRGVYTVPAVSELFNATFTVTRTIKKEGGRRSGYIYIYNETTTVNFVSAWSGKVDIFFLLGNSSASAIKISGSHSAGDTLTFNTQQKSPFSNTAVWQTPFKVYTSDATLFSSKTGKGTTSHTETFTVSATVTTTEVKKETDNQQYVYRTLQQGFTQQAIEEIKADDETLISFKDSPVTSLNTAIGGDLFNGSQIEIKQGGEDFTNEEFTYKMDVQNVNDSLELADSDSYEDLIYTLPTNTKSLYIPLEFPSGLYTTTDSGKRADRTIKTLVEYSTDGGENYSTLDAQFDDNGTITNKKRQDLFYVLEHDFSDAEVIAAVKNAQPIKIKISCLTNESEGTAVDNMTVTQVRSRLCDSIQARKGVIAYEKVLSTNVDKTSVKIGLKLLTTQSNKDKCKKIQVVSWGLARVWDSENRVWSTEKEKTRNPASWLLEVLTSDTHTPSKVSDSEIDLESFGDYFEYCDENELNIDYVITQGDTKENIIKKVLEVGNASLYRSIYGKMAVAIDDVKENAVAILNQQNIISFSAEKNLTRPMDGYRITFPVADTWENDTKVFLRDGSDYDSLEDTTNLNIEELTIDTFTADADNADFGQVYKYARRKLNAEILRTHKYSIEIGKEGYYFPLFSRVKVQHPALFTGLGSASIKRIITENDTITGLELFGSAYYSSAERYGAVIQCVGSEYSRLLNIEYTAEKDGYNNVITFVTPIESDASTIPFVDNILSYGTLGEDGSFKTITNDITITEITPTTTGYKLTGVDYNDELFEYGTIPEYESNLTTPRSGSVNKTVTTDDLLEKTEEIKTTLEKAVTVDVVSATVNPSDVSSCSGIAEKDGIQLSAVAGGSTIYDNVKNFVYELSRDGGTSWESVTGSYYSFDRTKDGYPEKSAFVNYKVRAKALSSYDLKSSNWVEGTVSASGNYGTWTLSAPSVSAKATENKIEIAINDEANASVWGFKQYSLSHNSSGTLSKVDDWNYILDITGLYLEKSDIADITFTARVETEADSKTNTCTADTSEYLTYLPSVPNVSYYINGRGLNVSFSHEDFYEFSHYEIQISQDGSNWYSFGANDTARTDSTVWKGELNADTDVSGKSWGATLALSGEGESLPTDTIYYFRARTKGHTASNWTSAQSLTATATHANDVAENAVTSAHIQANAVINGKIADNAITETKIEDNSISTSKIQANAITADLIEAGAIKSDLIASGSVVADKINVDNLSAISSTLGDVIAGSLASNSKTEEGKTVQDPDSSSLYLNSKSGEEEFYIGNVARGDFVEGQSGHEALWFKTLTDGTKTILFQISNFIVTSVSSIIKGLFKVQAKGSDTSFISANPTSAVIDGDADSTPAKTMLVNGTVKATTLDATTVKGTTGNITTVTATTGNITTVNATTLKATNSGATALSVTGNATITGSVNNLVQTSEGRWGQTQTVDLSDTSVYDTDTYYPVVCYCTVQEIIHFTAYAFLFSQSGVSWASHPSGSFYAQLSLDTIGNRWGAAKSPPYLRIYTDEYVWLNDSKKPIYYKQLVNNSRLVFLMRGGAKYWITCSRTFSMEILTDSKTYSQQSIAPTTSPSSDVGYIRGESTYLDKQTFSSAISVTGGTTTDTLTASGATTLSSTLAVTGKSSLKGGCDVTGTLTASGATTLSSTLAVTGKSSLKGGCDVTGTLTASGATTLSSTLAVTGKSSLKGGCDVTGTLTASGATTLSSTLAVTGNATLSAGCTIGGKSAISGTTSEDAIGNLILNLYTN